MNGLSIEQFFQYLNGNGLKKTDSFLKMIIKPEEIVSHQQYQSYDQQLKNIFNALFSQKELMQEELVKIQLEKLLPFNIKKTAMPVCNKLLNTREEVYRCYDCTSHQSAVLCKACFQNGNHKGHRFLRIQSGGGNCDCGNPDAINPQGYCINHSGKAQPAIIDQKQQQHFLRIMRHIFSWLFLMFTQGPVKKVKRFDCFGYNLSSYLQKLNQQSLHYNTLTYKLLCLEVIDKFGNQTILTKILRSGITCLTFGQKTTELFLNMFSLQIFKYQLSAEFTHAYNRFKGFQLSSFKSLYIQLFANNEIVQKLAQNEILIWPYGLDYNYPEYIQNLLFLGTIKKEVAEKYFLKIIQKGIIQYKMLHEIQKKVQEGQQHIVVQININLNNQNSYYSLIEVLINLFKDSQKILYKMLAKYIQQIQSQKYSFIKNKIVLPYQRAFGIITFAIFEGNLNNVNANQLAKFLGRQKKQDIFNTVKVIFKRTLKCLKQFAQTFIQASYFDNYIPLYSKSGHTIVNYDIITLRICSILMKQINEQKIADILLQTLGHSIQSCSKSLQQIYQEQDPNIIINNKKKQDQKIEKILLQHKINRQCIKILIEVCMSNRSDVLLSNQLQFKNQYSTRENELMMIALCKNFTEFSVQELKQIERHFFTKKNVQWLYRKYLPFDKNKKKNIFVSEGLQKFKRYPLQHMETLKKVGGIFNVNIKQEQQTDYLNIDIFSKTISEKIIQIIFSPKFLHFFCLRYLEFVQTIISSKQYSEQRKTLQAQFFQSIKVLRTLNKLLFFQKNQIINNLFSKLQDLYRKSQKQKCYAFLSQFFCQKKEQMIDQKKQNVMKKLKEKKMKRMLELKNMQDKFKTDHIMEEEEDCSKCIICREDSKNTKNSLCYLSSFKYTNLFQSITGCEGRFLTFGSCFHPIHVQCFLKANLNEYIACPLCKTQSNIMIPIEEHMQNQNVVKKLIQRIQILRSSWGISNVNHSQSEQFIVLALLNSIVQKICTNLLKNQQILSQKQLKIAKHVYLMLRIFFLEMNNENAQKEVNMIKIYMESLQQREKLKQGKGYSGQALSRLILKLLFSSLINSKVKQENILEQFKNLLVINEIQYCWKMVSKITNLNEWKLTEVSSLAKYEIKTMIKFYQPPQNIYDLISLRDVNQVKCNKNGHQVCVCVICSWKSCYDCKQVQKHVQLNHCGQGLVFNISTGGFYYQRRGPTILMPSNYTNELGVAWKPIFKPQQFLFDHQTYTKILESILNNSLLEYLMMKHPMLVTRNLFAEEQFDFNV